MAGGIATGFVAPTIKVLRRERGIGLIPGGSVQQARTRGRSPRRAITGQRQKGFAIQTSGGLERVRASLADVFDTTRCLCGACPSPTLQGHVTRYNRGVPRRNQAHITLAEAPCQYDEQRPGLCRSDPHDLP